MLSARNILNRRINFEEYRFISDQDFALENARTNVQPGDVLLTIVGAIGRIAVVPNGIKPFALQRSVAVLKPNGGVLPQYLAYAIEAPKVQQFLRDNAKGTAQKGIYLKALGRLQLPLAPLPEQQRLANRLDSIVGTVDACRARLDQVPLILRKFREAVLESAVSGRLTEEWRASSLEESNCVSELEAIAAQKFAWADANDSHNEAARVRKRAAGFSPDSLESRGLPESWAWVSIGDACLLVVDCHNKTAPYSASGIPLVRTSNIRDGKIVWDDMRHVDEATYDYWSRRCPPVSGDIVFTREAPIGEAAIIPDKLTLCLGQRTMLFRPIHGLTNSRFLLLTLQDTAFKRRAIQAAVGTGVKHLRVGDVADLSIPIAPLKEQREIVRRVDELFALADSLQRRYINTARQLETLTPSVLSKAFRGELVPQDPNEEPAGEMLERMRAVHARESAPAMKIRAVRSKGS
jgi:type I restriction enzyme, S subunit